jgi:hypothetical protein
MQRALFPVDGPVLIYSQDRELELEARLDESMKTLFEVYGLEHCMKAKLFAAAHLDEENRLVIDDVLDTDLGW